MNEYQQNLYRDLMNLVEGSDAFYFQDFHNNGNDYRIFNYRLGSYSDFCLNDSGLECRGHMFQVQHNSSPQETKMLRLASLPPEKFFNLNENPSTMDLDLSQVELIEDKADGSLISTYINPGEGSLTEPDVVKLKSKGALFSDQALDAMQWLKTQLEFRDELTMLTAMGYTVSMEWCAPHNRIVIGYSAPALNVLSIRNTMDGTYMDRDEIHDTYSNVHERWVERFDVEDPEEFIKSVPDMKDIEGFVVRFKSGQRVKIKTNWYITRHHTKDSINSPRRLFEAVLEEASDDLRTLFFDDEVALKMIADMEAFTEEKYNGMVEMVESFYNKNKDLERKDYAIKGQEHFKGTLFFSLAMSKYLGKDVNYKDFLKSKWKQLGLKDEAKDCE